MAIDLVILGQAVNADDSLDDKIDLTLSPHREHWGRPTMHWMTMNIDRRPISTLTSGTDDCLDRAPNGMVTHHGPRKPRRRATRYRVMSRCRFTRQLTTTTTSWYLQRALGETAMSGPAQAPKPPSRIRRSRAARRVLMVSWTNEDAVHARSGEQATASAEFLVAICRRLGSFEMDTDRTLQSVTVAWFVHGPSWAWTTPRMYHIQVTAMNRVGMVRAVATLVSDTVLRAAHRTAEPAGNHGQRLDACWLSWEVPMDTGGYGHASITPPSYNVIGSDAHCNPEMTQWRQHHDATLTISAWKTTRATW